jgi:hypothetical protein
MPVTTCFVHTACSWERIHQQGALSSYKRSLTLWFVYTLQYTVDTQSPWPTDALQPLNYC